MLAVLLVVVLVVVLLSCCYRCLRVLCCCVANTFAAATVGTPPPLPLLPLMSVGKEDDACYMDSSPATSAQAVWRALESRASLDRPLPAGRAGGKGGDDDGSTNGGGRSRIAHQIGMVLPSPTRGGTTATRVVGK
jgi:hypothetical protein